MKTNTENPAGVKQFIAYLTEHFISPTLMELKANAHTASGAADALGCDISQIVKSLVFITRDTQRPLLVLVSGANKVNTQRLSEILGEKVILADEQTVLKITNYPVGAVPPAGFRQDLFTLIDEDLASHERLWTSGGSVHSLVAMSFQELCQLTGGKVTTVSRPLAEPVIIVPYDPHWAIQFDTEKELIQTAIGKYLKLIEHIGSTSVPGLAAKPIIDIMAGAISLADAPLFIPPLERLGYHYVPEFEAQMPERRYLTRSDAGRMAIHLHVLEPTTQRWKDHLAFRDLLIANPGIREAYAHLKINLAECYGNNRVSYTDAKTEFIQNSLKQTHW
ncbi:MAG: GrpB family protein [Anaerolineaceae bacterium]